MAAPDEEKALGEGNAVVDRTVGAVGSGVVGGGGWDFATSAPTVMLKRTVGRATDAVLAEIVVATGMKTVMETDLELTDRTP